MAPYVPEEVDVFSVPHSRMKELVNDYYEMIGTTNFSSTVDLELLLESLLKTFMEFKTHEQIENKFIMHRLKVKLKKLSIQNTAVCNCHKDNRMTEIVSLLKAGFTKKTAQDRINYGLQLKVALEEFTSTFLPHMKEEEEVFQPLLLQYFTYEELCELKENVIHQHVVKKSGEAKDTEKEPWENSAENDSSCGSESEEEDSKEHSVATAGDNVAVSAAPSTSFSELPPELALRVFSHLSPQDLCKAAQVNKEWNQLAFDQELWRTLLPIQWAQGDWSFTDNRPEWEEEEDTFPGTQLDYHTVDDDADIDESGDADDGYQQVVQRVQREAQILTGLAKHVLPRAGREVQMLILANSRTLTNSMLNRMLRHTPNLEVLDLSQTRIADSGLKSFGRNNSGARLKKLVLSGCVNVTDVTMMRLAMALSQQENTAGENACLCEQYYKSCQHARESCTESDDTHAESSCNKVIKEAPESDDEEKEVDSSEEGDGESMNSNGANSDTHSGSYDKNVKTFQPFRITEVVSGEPEMKESPDHPDAATTDIEDSILTQWNPDSPSFRSLSQQNTDCASEQRDTGEVAQDVASSVGRVIRYEGQVACHNMCDETDVDFETDPSLEDCDKYVEKSVTGYCNNSGQICKNAGKCRLNKPEKRRPVKLVPEGPLEFLDLSGCFQVTDTGLRALSGITRYPNLHHLDLSGCLHVSSAGIAEVVSVCPNLDHARLYYCDNITDGPYANTASGCQNLECTRRVCCRSGH